MWQKANAVRVCPEPQFDDANIGETPYWGLPDFTTRKEKRRMLKRYASVPLGAKWGEGFMSRFPVLFKDRSRPMTETCMCWGIDCPIGWWHILDQLCTVLECLNIEHEQYGVAIVAVQVKEKMGALRFYYNIECSPVQGMAPERQALMRDRLDLLAWNAIDEAERMTETTCAECGSPLGAGTWGVEEAEQKGHWISHVCVNCSKESVNTKATNKQEVQ